MAITRGSETRSLVGRCWRLAAVVDHSAFFRNLPELLPRGAVIVLEGGRHPEDLQAFIRKHEVVAGVNVAAGTAWPRQRMHHLPATPEVLGALADLTEHCAAPEVCAHLHAYENDEVLLQWFDAFSEPLYVSTLISQDRLERFCSALRITYAEDECGAEGEQPSGGGETRPTKPADHG